MAILELYSRRERAERAECPDVYQYTVIPEKLRIQVWHIITDAIGEDRSQAPYTRTIHEWVEGQIYRNFGLLTLPGLRYGVANSVRDFFIAQIRPSRILDIIELYFIRLHGIRDDRNYQMNTKNRVPVADSIADLNKRFQDHSVGFQLEGKKFIRIDSTYLHGEVVRPALAVLGDARFAGPNEEFLAAHEHYRHSRYEECMVECCKAFESTMKTICMLRSWTFDPTSTAKTLISVCLAHGLLARYSDQQLTSLRTLFESGIPTVRNKEGGHGQGAERREVSEHLARYVLNMTATTILFFIDSEAAGQGATNTPR